MRRQTIGNRLRKIGPSRGISMSGSMAFNPASLSPVLWLTAGIGLLDNATDPISLNGVEVYTWQDRTLNAHDFVRVSSGPDTVTVNSTIVPSFTPNDLLSGGNLSAFFPSAATLAIRYREDSAGTTAVMQTADALNCFDRFGGSSYPGVLRTNRLDVKPEVPTGTVTQLWRSDASGWTRRVNGSQDMSEAAAYGSAGVDNWKIGCGGASGFHTGPVYEIIAYASYLSDANAALVEAYMSAGFP